MAKLPSDEILQIFRDTDALLEGHFQLTSGLHSPNYFQCAKVLQYPRYLHLFAGEIVKHFEYSEIELVIAPAMGGIVVATEVGRMLGARTIFAERKDGVLQLRRGFVVKPGERTLVVEDVVTTGGSVFETIDIVKKAKGIVSGVGYIVDRSGGKVKFDSKSYSVLSMDVITYQPADCPLCAQGSPVEKPGSRSTKP